ncbi:MAG: carbohydrate ABC transporter permease [Deinococcales bacterium]
MRDQLLVKPAPRPRRFAPVALVRNLPFHVVAAVFSLLFLLPLYWFVISTTKDASQLYQGTLTLGSPNHFIHDNLTGVFAFQNGVFGLWLVNSFLYAGVGALVGTFVAALAGFAFRRYGFFGKRLLFVLILGFALVPPFATALPLFSIFRDFGLLDTRWSVLIPSLVNVFGVYLMVVYWNQVPDELFDAAMIDGANDVTIFFRVGLPNILPGFTTLILLAFVTIWNNYFLPLVMLSDSAKYPLIRGIITITSLLGFPIYNLNIMGAFLTSIPLLIMFLVMQRFLAPQLTGAVR